MCITPILGAVVAIAGVFLLVSYVRARRHTYHVHVHAHPGAHPHAHVHQHAAGEDHGHTHPAPRGKLAAALVIFGAGFWLLAAGSPQLHIPLSQQLIASALAVFALGLRHGADPDHLAAINNMTRNSSSRAPVLSRFIGAIFAGGHTVMVLGIAALVGYLGLRFTTHSAVIENAGTALSIIVLLAIAALNLRQLARGRSDSLAGVKTRLLPRALRDATSPWIALPVGLLFGLGFETSSQIAAYAIAFSANGGVTGALIVGAMFCAGMICTDTLDSLFIHHLVTYQAGRLPHVMRVWIVSVTVFALAVAGYEFAQLFGWKPPLPDIAVSATMVAALLAVFTWIFFTIRSTQPEEPAG